MIEYKDGFFGLHGDGFSCLLRVNPYGLLELLHFGEPVQTADGEAFLCRQGLGWGASVLLDDADAGSCPDAMPLAWSDSGRGDYRESPIELAMERSLAHTPQAYKRTSRGANGDLCRDLPHLTSPRVLAGEYKRNCNGSDTCTWPFLCRSRRPWGQRH